MDKLKGCAEAQRRYFSSGATLDIGARKQSLKALLSALDKWSDALYEALWTDLHKSREEAYLTEISIVIAETRNQLRHIAKWSAVRRVATPLKLFNSCSRIVPEPLGCALVIAPWNYPVQLLLNPLSAALAAGCTVTLKPSPYVPNVSRVLCSMIRDSFPGELVSIFEGDRTVNAALLEQRWDCIFFTGSPVLGKVVMQAAARNLTPVVLELGGKSPCIVDRDARLDAAAKRIAWGKLLNAGQTCVAPDYLLVHREIRDAFLRELKAAFESLLGAEPKTTPHYVRMVSEKAYARVCSYIDGSTVLFGGERDAAERYIAPTVVLPSGPDAPVMQEEIFGPVLPLLEFGELDEALEFVNSREKPLALYYFGGKGKSVMRRTSSGGACINDTIMHFVGENLPFGGVGNSGMGSYHGKKSFEAFTHYKSVLKSSSNIDNPFRYMPYSWIRVPLLGPLVNRLLRR